MIGERSEIHAANPKSKLDVNLTSLVNLSASLIIVPSWIFVTAHSVDQCEGFCGNNLFKSGKRSI
jgi:hypothetical protein